MEDTAPLCLSFPTCKTGPWWSASTCIPDECWRRGRCSKPGRDGASPGCSVSPSSPHPMAVPGAAGSTHTWPGWSRAFFAIRAPPVRLCQHWPGAKRHFCPQRRAPLALSVTQALRSWGGKTQVQFLCNFCCLHRCFFLVFLPAFRESINPFPLFLSLSLDNIICTISSEGTLVQRVSYL